MLRFITRKNQKLPMKPGTFGKNCQLNPEPLAKNIDKKGDSNARNIRRIK